MSVVPAPPDANRRILNRHVAHSLLQFPGEALDLDQLDNELIRLGDRSDCQQPL
ncbi:MAG TPA: hypothetical protein VFB89_11090 [Gemmatimonadales bacterium]|nr:hypothetical protein [Gemmatimonadales bacterium]